LGVYRNSKYGYPAQGGHNRRREGRAAGLIGGQGSRRAKPEEQAEEELAEPSRDLPADRSKLERGRGLLRIAIYRG